ncbi:hypothetical protein ABPG73_009969 [Tetrahymena malaccensis]
MRNLDLFQNEQYNKNIDTDKQVFQKLVNIIKGTFILISLISILSITSLYLISDNQDTDLLNIPRCFSFNGQIVQDSPTFEHSFGFFAQNKCIQKIIFQFISSTKQGETVCLKYDEEYIRVNEGGLFFRLGGKSLFPPANSSSSKGFNQELNREERAKDLLNQNQLNQQASYPQQFQNQEGSYNIQNKLMNININMTSESTLLKQVKSQIVRRFVCQNRIFQNAICQLINQNEDQHAIISYQNKDNQNITQLISSKNYSNQYEQSKEHQITFQQSQNVSQNGFGHNQGKKKEKQNIKETNSNDHINCMQIIKLQEKNDLNIQKSEQKLNKKQSTHQDNGYSQENSIRKTSQQDNNFQQNNLCKKQSQIESKQINKEVIFKNQINRLQLENFQEKAFTNQQKDQQLNQKEEHISYQGNACEQENSEGKAFYLDQYYSQNDLSKMEDQIKQDIKVTISNNNEINCQKLKQIEEKAYINQKKEEQHHTNGQNLNKKSSNNLETIFQQENADTKTFLQDKCSLSSDLSKKQIQIEQKQITKQSISNNQINDVLLIEFQQNNEIRILKKDFQHQKIQKQRNGIITYQVNDNQQSYFSQIKKIFDIIQSYQFDEYKKLKLFDTPTNCYQIVWEQEIFDADLILGFYLDDNEGYDEYIFKIIYNSDQSDIYLQNQIIKTLGFECDLIKIENNQISDEGVLNISIGIEKLHHIADFNIDLCKNRISYLGVQHLCSSLEKIQNITHLSIVLDNNMIGPEGAQSIVSAIVKFKNNIYYDEKEIDFKATDKSLNDGQINLSKSENNINENEVEIIKKNLQKKFIQLDCDENKNNIYYDENEIDKNTSDKSLNDSYINVDFAQFSQSINNLAFIYLCQNFLNFKKQFIQQQRNM